MARNRIEVAVIDDRLLVEGIANARSIEGDPVRGSGEINLVEVAPTVPTLILSFKKISRIENLVGFDSLIKLCLDNNCIEDITGLGHLTTLRWLDLSFNKIRRIQGLETLVNLEDLSLYCNKISTIEGLEQCKNLQCLSIGNNRIESLEQVIRLRKIRSLRMLTLSDNPVCSESEYKMIILAHVDTIKYLDYALVDQAERDTAKEQYQDELLDVEEKESVIAEKEAREKGLSIYLAQLDEAGILFAHTLFDDMFADDSDIERLKHLPMIREQVDIFRTSFKTLSDEYIRNALEKYEEKRKEINNFERAVAGIRSRDDAECTHLIEGFHKSKKAVVAHLTSGANISHSECQRMVKKLQDELEKVCDELMSIELRLVEKFDALVDHFDDRLNELKNIAHESQQLFFRNIEDHEDKFSTQIRIIAMDLIDRVAREELADDYLDDEGMSLVLDKDTCMAVISASHEMHIGRILKREDEARGTETRRYQELIGNHTSKERSRNRNRILEIHEFSNTSKSSLAALLSLDDDEGFEEEDIQHGK